MSYRHNDLNGLQGGRDTFGTGVVDVTNFYHVNLIGDFNVTLGVESIVEDDAIDTDSRVFLSPANAEAAALATAGFFAEVGVGSFTATHGSAEATDAVFNYIVG